jgi:predicted kinase
MATFFAMCGLAFSGKTTLAGAIARLTGAAYVGLDDINLERGLHGGEGIPPEEWEKTSQVAVERIARWLEAGLDVVLDDTLCFRWLRDRYSALAERCAATFVLVYVRTPLPEIRHALVENETLAIRPSIRPEVFEAHARTFEHPTPDERPVVYDRTIPGEDWVVRRLLGAQRPP